MPTAILTATYINAHLPQGVTRATPADFVPGAVREGRVSPSAESAIWRQWAEAHNRAVK